jgi:hypothetical protein
MGDYLTVVGLLLLSPFIVVAVYMLAGVLAGVWSGIQSARRDRRHVKATGCTRTDHLYCFNPHREAAIARRRQEFVARQAEESRLIPLQLVDARLEAMKAELLRVERSIGTMKRAAPMDLGPATAKSARARGIDVHDFRQHRRWRPQSQRHPARHGDPVSEPLVVPDGFVVSVTPEHGRTVRCSQCDRQWHVPDGMTHLSPRARTLLRRHHTFHTPLIDRSWTDAGLEDWSSVDPPRWSPPHYDADARRRGLPTQKDFEDGAGFGGWRS